jgi:hypothetical protein
MTDERYKKIMEDLGMPNSRSLLVALQQVANEAGQECAAAEREACGEIANKKAADVLAKNRFFGDATGTARFAAEMLEDVGLKIRMRSNA